METSRTHKARKQQDDGIPHADQQVLRLAVLRRLLGSVDAARAESVSRDRPRSVLRGCVLEQRGDLTLQKAYGMYEKTIKHMKYQQRSLSRRWKGSTNCKKLRQRAIRTYEHVADIRCDFAHKTTTQLVRENQAVFART